MSTEKLDINTKLSEKFPDNIEIVTYTKWDKMEFPTNLLFLRLQYALLALFFILLFFPALAAINIVIEGVPSLFINGLLFIGFAFMLLVLGIIYINNVSIEYIAEAGKLYKMNNKIVGELQGKIVVRKGRFNRTVTNLVVSEFDRVTVSQSFLGKYFNYGTVILEQVDKLQKTDDIRLEYIRNPRKAAEIIQNMVDLAKGNMANIMPV